MRLSERNLMALATAYVEDGKLKKWRFYSEDTRHINRILHEKCVSGTTITEEELDYILTFERVIIVDKFRVRFENFSGTVSRY